MKLYFAGATSTPEQERERLVLRLVEHRLMSYFTIAFDKTCELKVFEMAINESLLRYFDVSKQSKRNIRP